MIHHNEEGNFRNFFFFKIRNIGFLDWKLEKIKNNDVTKKMHTFGLCICTQDTEKLKLFSVHLTHYFSHSLVYL